MLVRVCLLAVLAAGCAATEIIDRIAARVGKEVITESELVRNMRMTAFIEGRPVDAGAQAKRRALERLIDQALVRREMDLSLYPVPDSAETQKLLDDFRAEHYKADGAYKRELAEHGVTEDDLRRHLEWQLTFLRFLQLRFRPGVQVAVSELREYYRTEFAPALRQQGKTVPPFDQARAAIDATLTAKRMDQNVERWLAEARKNVRIEVREEALK